MSAAEPSLWDVASLYLASPLVWLVLGLLLAVSIVADRTGR